jgi:hypothetical protein
MRSETMKPAVQILETLCDEHAALHLYGCLAAQQGVTHIRILQPSRSKPGFRVQALMVGAEIYGASLPDGMRRVMVSDAILASFDAVGP